MGEQNNNKTILVWNLSCWHYHAIVCINWSTVDDISMLSMRRIFRGCFPSRFINKIECMPWPQLAPDRPWSTDPKECDSLQRMIQRCEMCVDAQASTFTDAPMNIMDRKHYWYSDEFVFAAPSTIAVILNFISQNTRCAVVTFLVMIQFLLSSFAVLHSKTLLRTKPQCVV